MSAAEKSRLAANAKQIADFSSTLSISLFTYTRKLRIANKEIDALSNGIASAGAVLKELAQALSNEHSSHLCSQDALNIATALVRDIQIAFSGLEGLLDSDGSERANTPKEPGSKQQGKLWLLDSQADQSQANLERLKLSLLLILNVLIFADLLRNREPLLVLKHQRELVRVLAAEKEESDRAYTEFGKSRLKSPTHEQGYPTDVPRPMPKHARTFSVNAIDDRFVMSPISATSPMGTRQFNIPNIDVPINLRHHYERIQHHSYLVGNLLSEISSLRYKLDHGTRDRLHNGVLNLHWNEWGRYRSLYGQEVFDQMLTNHEEIARYWTDQSININASRPSPRQPLPPFEYPDFERATLSPGGSSLGSGLGISSIERARTNFDQDGPQSGENIPEQFDADSIDEILNKDSGGNVRNDSAHRPENQRQRSVTLQDPWHSNQTGERRPSIEVTGPEYIPERTQQSDAINVPESRIRPTVSIPTTPSSPGTSGAQTPISPNELTKRLSYERLRSPPNSTQTSPAVSPALRKATLRSARAASSGDIESDLSRRNSRTGGSMRPRPEREFSNTYNEELLSPGLGRTGSVKDKARGSGTVKLIDPLGRKFKCPLEKCSTWEDMHKLVEAQFHQHPQLLPEVRADNYDLFSAAGQRISITDWARTVANGLPRVTMLLRYGNPEAGFRKRDCLIPFDGENVLVPDMLDYITKQDPHNAYRTKLIPPAPPPMETGNGSTPSATPAGPPPVVANSAKDKFANVENLERRGSDAAGRTHYYEQRQPSRTVSGPSLFVLDEVDRLVLRLTTIRQSELKMIRWDDAETEPDD